MLLVADSGSTKTDWLLRDHRKEIHPFSTVGFNPFFVNSEDVREELNEVLIRELKKEVALFKREDIRQIYFYGAGCSSPARNSVISNALKEVFPEAAIAVEHDLLGAARALFGRKAGIAAILGTGSNSCHYDGEQVLANIGGIGYILGDEGSGAYMGKQLVRSFMYGDFPRELLEKFEAAYQLNKDDIMVRVYQKPNPNRFLAAFSEFINAHRKEPLMDELIHRCFRDFFDWNICKYPGYEELPMACVGSIGYYYSDVLKKVAMEKEMKVEKILKAPIEELMNFHFTGND